jgi:hypothetical protein
MSDVTKITSAQKRLVIEALCRLAAEGAHPTTLTQMREALIREIAVLNALPS